MLTRCAAIFYCNKLSFAAAGDSASLAQQNKPSNVSQVTILECQILIKLYLGYIFRLQKEKKILYLVRKAGCLGRLF